MSQQAFGTEEMFNEISMEFKIKINEIFGSNLMFAFICGGVGKGYATDFTHDIDMFICLNNNLSGTQEKEFKDFYLNIHQVYGLTPDHLDPGEITTYGNLCQTLNFLEQLKINLTIRTYEEYEAIVRGEILSGKIGLTTGPNLNLLASLKRRCRGYPAQWRKQILAEVSIKRFTSEQIVLLEEILELLEKLEKNLLSFPDKLRLNHSIKHFKDDYSLYSTKHYLNSNVIRKLRKLDINFLFELFVIYLAQVTRERKARSYSYVHVG